jgi:hypothetical protein
LKGQGFFVCLNLQHEGAGSWNLDVPPGSSNVDARANVHVQGAFPRRPHQKVRGMSIVIWAAKRWNWSVGMGQGHNAR